MVGNWFDAEQAVNAESFPNYRAHPIGRRGVSRVCGVFGHLGDRAERGGRCRGSWHGAAPRYELVDIDPYVVETLRHRGPDSFLAHFGDYRPSIEPRIGIGERSR